MSDVSPAAEPCRDHPEEITGRYRLGPVLRRSPGCCSHRAVDRLLRRTVSVTLVDRPGPHDLTLPEQSWLGRPPEVAELYDGGAWRGRTFLVTQHPEALTLAETTAPGGLTVAEVRDLGVAVTGVLAPLHRHGRAHGGLGPGTVAWSERGAALSDVGLLPWLAQWSDLRLDPPFPAPESGAAPAADVYALGRLLHELAPRRVPGALRALLDGMTAASPLARPGIEDVAERLAALPVSSRRRAGAAAARGRRAVVVAAAVLLLAGGAGLGALVTASGDGSGAAYASAAEPTPVPGVPLPPAVAVAAPPVPEPLSEPVSEPVAASLEAEPVRSRETSDESPEPVAATEALAARPERRSDSDRPEARERTDSEDDERGSDASEPGSDRRDESRADESRSDDRSGTDRSERRSERLLDRADRGRSDDRSHGRGHGGSSKGRGASGT